MIESNRVYRFIWRWSGRDRPSGTPPMSINTSNRARLDGADVLVIKTDTYCAQVETLDGTTFTVWTNELHDRAKTEAHRFASYVPPAPVGPRPNLTRDIEVAESTAARALEVAERASESGDDQGYVDQIAAAAYAQGVADYARLFRDGEQSNMVRELLD